jgi:hypothetical protein
VLVSLVHFLLLGWICVAGKKTGLQKEEFLFEP